MQASGVLEMWSASGFERKLDGKRWTWLRLC